MSQYPILRFLVLHGLKVAVVLACLPVMAVLGAILLGAISPWWMFVAGAGGAVVGVAVMSYVELIRVVTDMLLPQ